MDGREGFDGAAHHEMEQARVGAVERGGRIAGLLLMLVGDGGGGGGVWGGGEGEAEERDEEDDD